MATVTIYHNASEAVVGDDGRLYGRFHTYHPDNELVEAYHYDTDETDLEVIWETNNVVSGDEHPYLYGTRSLSVGDVVDVDGVRYSVEPVGFARLGKP